MDITKFNKNLAEKVAKANAYEKNNRIQDAIDTWVEISEMALNASKTNLQLTAHPFVHQPVSP